VTVEARVERAAESVLSAHAECAETLTHGDINRVFKVVAGGRAFVLKVFSNPDWPEEGKLPWIESSLAARAVPRARLLHYTRGAEFFPHGFSLSEYLPGANCKQAVREGRLGPLEYLELAGRFLRTAHDITPPRFGYLGEGRGTEDDYVGWIVGCELKDRADELAGAPGLERDACARAAARVEKTLRRFERRFRPALLHADATPKNAILTEPGRLVLVDWDEAFAGPWLWDYTHLSYWYSYMLHRGGLEVRDKAEVRAAFFRGHGAPEFDDEELDALEAAMHTVEALGVLSFFFRRGDAGGFAHARRLLSRLLDAPAY
jgi:Ser/Thr protein kinase RdoA (MazF antagonist)